MIFLVFAIFVHFTPRVKHVGPWVKMIKMSIEIVPFFLFYIILTEKWSTNANCNLGNRPTLLKQTKTGLKDQEFFPELDYHF